MKRCSPIVVGVALAATCALAPAEGRAGLGEPVYVVDSPTAGLLGHREYHIQGRIGPESSIILTARVGFMHFLHVGMSFGMQRVFERDEISVNDQVGFQARVRLLDEHVMPAVAVGFDSQGVGIFDESVNRYERKSLGFYGVLSKNWLLPVGEWSLHGGVNYTLETDDNDDELNGFAAGEWLVFGGFALVLDANAALNDNREDGSYGSGGLYVDGAVRVNYGENLSMMLIFRDLAGNFEPDEKVAREFEIALVNSF